MPTVQSEIRAYDLRGTLAEISTTADARLAQSAPVRCSLRLRLIDWTGMTFNANVYNAKRPKMEAPVTP